MNNCLYCKNKINNNFSLHTFMSRVDDFYNLENLTNEQQLGFIILSQNYYCSFDHYIKDLKDNLQFKFIESIDKNNLIDGDDYLYFFQFGNQNIIKIGVSNKPPRRKHDLETKLPYKIKLLNKFKLKNAYKIENIMHKYFDNQRMNGEWFRLDRKEIDYIKNMSLNKMIKKYLIDDLEDILKEVI